MKVAVLFVDTVDIVNVKGEIILKIILINGESRSGKSTVATMIQKRLSYKSVLIKNNSEYVMEVCEKVFGWNPLKEGKSRRARQLFREVTHTGYNFDNNFWEKKTLEKVRPYIANLDYLIIPDWRYKCTYDFWANLGYEIFTIKVERPNFNNGYNEEVKKDDIGYLNDVDFNLYMFNTGTLENLEEIVNEGVEMMRW